MKESIEKKYYLLSASILFSLLILVIFLFLLPEAKVMGIVAEGGILEICSVISYFLGGIIAFYLSKRGVIKDRYLMSFLLIILGLRELDFHKAFTTMSISSTRYYLSPKVPVLEKLIVAPIVLFILIAIFFFLKKYTLAYIKNLINKTPLAIIIFPSFLLFMCSKLADSSLSMFRDASIAITPMMEKTAFIIEESFELGIPVFFIVGLLYLLETKRTS
ncbi:MAG: hypothetical protein HYZ79_00205 [Candidatus Melainabacteria bacterium]|nr:hypothetical protein [Candidatus Melainabacteria bacterium]